MQLAILLVDFSLVESRHKVTRMSPEPDSPSQNQHLQDASQSEPTLGDSPDADLLAEVLRQTEWNDDAESWEDVELLNALKTVATQFPDTELTLEPTGLALVSAALEYHFGRLNLSQEAWERMCHRIARSLLEDPVSHDRWSELWSHLTGASHE